jgi:hypothetical protein
VALDAVVLIEFLLSTRMERNHGDPDADAREGLGQMLEAVLGASEQPRVVEGGDERDVHPS